MTYEELLEKFTDYEAHFDQVQDEPRVFDTLRSIVELHYPKPYAQDTQYPFDGCAGCGREYPCPTIETIKRKLT